MIGSRECSSFEAGGEVTDANGRRLHLGHASCSQYEDELLHGQK